LGIEFVNRRSAPHRVALAEDLLEIAMKQFVDTVIHNKLFLTTREKRPVATTSTQA
jgi:hypothetical protein